MDQNERIDRHPIFRMVRQDWLARETGYAYQTVRSMACGRRSCTAAFRAKCAAALGMDEAVLFHDDDGSQTSQSVDPDGSESDRAVNVVARAESYSTPQEVAISRIN